MANRIRLQKLLALKEKHWKLQIAKSAKLEQQIQDISNHERQILALLDSEGVASALFLDMTLSKLRDASNKKQDAARALEKQTEVSQQAGKSVRMLEKIVDRAGDEAAREEAKKELSQAADLALHPSRFSLP